MIDNNFASKKQASPQTQSKLTTEMRLLPGR